jgi:hypothetical protein
LIMIGKTQILMIFIVMVSCTGTRVDEQTYKELLQMNWDLESLAREKHDQLKIQLTKFTIQIEERGYDPKKNKDYIAAEELVKRADEFSGFIKKWNYKLIDQAGGFSESGDLLNWDMMIMPKSAMPENDFGEMDLTVNEKQNVIISLLELSNKQLQFLNKQYEEFNLIKAKYENQFLDPYVKTRLELIQRMKTEYSETEGLMLWNMEYYPKVKFIVKGQASIQTNGELVYKKEEWDNLNLEKIEVPLIATDTTFTFYLKR